MAGKKGAVGLDLHRGITISPRAGAALAAGFYVLWMWFLFSPQLHNLSSFRFLFAANPAAAALGTYLLSRRWLAGWTPSILTGLFYGFGPFALSFVGFHPVAGLTFAAVPWLFLPAAYWQRGRQPNIFRFAIRGLMCTLPFAFILGFFWLFSQHWAGPLFLLPGKTMLSVYDFGGLFLPLSMAAGRPVIFGLGHVGLLTALMGLFVYLTVQRITVLLPAAIGLVLAFIDTVCGVSPIIWASLPMLFLSILAGIGVQSLLWAGKSDSKWVLICLLFAFGMAGVSLTLYYPDKADVYRNPVLFYLISIGGFTTLFALLRLGLRWVSLRWLILAGMIIVDCFISGQWLLSTLL